MAKHFPLYVPVEGKDNKTRYTRVGVMFENHRRDSDEVVYSIKMDFPVGATELVAFPPRLADDAEAENSDVLDQAGS